MRIGWDAAHVAIRHMHERQRGKTLVRRRSRLVVPANGFNDRRSQSPHAEQACRNFSMMETQHAQFRLPLRLTGGFRFFHDPCA